MKKFYGLFVCIIFVLFFMSNAYCADAVRIGVIDVMKLQEKSKAFQKVRKDLKEKFVALEKKLEKERNEVIKLEQELKKQSMMLSLDAKEDKRKDLEKKIKNGELKKVDTIVFINCVAALDEKHPHCCRVGCGVSIKNAKLIKQMFPDSKVYILYKDMRIFGKREEEYYGEVIGKYGVITIRYGDRKPEVIPQKDKVKVRVFDEIMREEVEIPADLVVLTINLQGESLTEKLKQILKVPADQAGFFLEAHAKIRPLDFSTDGIYLCGSAHYPKNLADAIAQAKGAASRAAIPIMQGFVTSEGIVAEVNEDLCSGCRICESICPYSAIEMKPYKGDEKRLVASVNEALCKGCGSCAAACPSGAIDQRGYTNEQIEEMVKVILEGAG